VLDITLEDTKKYIRDIAGTRVENILYYITFQIGVIGKHDTKGVGGMLKRPQKLKF
jgi:hypothetical protein